MNGKLPILTDNGNSNATLEILIPESYQKFTASNEPLVNIEDCILNNDKSWLERHNVCDGDEGERRVSVLARLVSQLR